MACGGAEETEICPHSHVSPPTLLHAAQIFQLRIQRKNVLEMFGHEHLIKRLHFLSYSK